MFTSDQAKITPDLNMIYCVFLPISAQVYPAFILYLHLINPPKKGLNDMVDKKHRNSGRY
jgi:hypothetical protein